MIIKNGFIYQFKEGKFQPIYGNLIIEDGRIKEIQKIPTSSFPIFSLGMREKENQDVRTQVNSTTSSNIDEIDAGGRMILPPLINFHEHIYSRLSKGLPVSGRTDNFLNTLENLWWKLDRALFAEAIEVSAEFTAIEAIKNGVGTVFDHHSSPNCISGSLNIIRNVLKKSGLRGILSYEVSDRNGIENMKEAVQENLDFYTKVQDENFKSQFGLHALFTLSDETLKYIKNKTIGMDIGFHIHAGEDLYDAEFNQQKYGLTLLKRMEKFHLLNEKTFLAHGNYLQGCNYPLLKKYKIGLVHNPDSNFNNAVGTLNIKDAL
jgi:cytosine/adenosine deaminase-related metal-dependent hydrolase